MEHDNAATRVREMEFPFTLERSADGPDGGDGLTFEGYAAVFNSPTRINDQDGEYDEVIMPGAFRQATTGHKSNPVLMFNHGRHPLIGPMPLGKITELREDARGLFVRARLTDNWLIAPVRDAIRDGAIDGMSFRFDVINDKWQPQGRGQPRLRTLKELKVPELGPVVFPAYSDTTAAVRSSFRDLESAIAVRVQVLEPAKTRDDDVTISTQDPTVADLVEEGVEDLWGLDESSYYPIEVFDDHVVFAVGGLNRGDYQGLWSVDFTYDNGTVSLGTPQRVQAGGFVPVDAPPTDLAQFDDSENLNSAPVTGETRAYSADDRKKMAAAGDAMPDGSYPIANKADLQNAIHAVGRGSGGHDTIRKHIIKRAKALGASDMIPNNWNAAADSMTGMNSNDPGPSQEAATTGPSDEVTTNNETAIRPSMTSQIDRDAYLRDLELQRRGIAV